VNSEREKIFIFGASGHAKVVIDIVELQGLYDIAFLADDDANLKDTTVYGYRVIGGKPELLTSGIKRGIVAIGNNRARCGVAEWLKDNGFEFVSAIHPSAQLARGVTIGSDSVVMAGTVINSDSTIGYDVIINTRASIDHDCTIGNGVHIAPGATLCGNVTVGAETFVCAGSTIIPNLIIGHDVIVGAGSTVIRNVSDQVTVVGSPAKVLKNKC
jgi:sugar O-acyltransferase (sialic acid O-acetyltransferase NeuD family)